MVKLPLNKAAASPAVFASGILQKRLYYKSRKKDEGRESQWI